MATAEIADSVREKQDSRLDCGFRNMSNFLKSTAVATLLVAIAHGSAAQVSSDLKKNAPLAVVHLELAMSHPYIQAKVNNSPPLSLIVDTGAANSSLDKMAASLAQLVVSGTAPAIGFGGEMTSQFSLSNTLSIDSESLSNVRFDIESLQPGIYGEHEGHLHNGAIGWNLFEHYAIEIDYGAKELRLYDRDRYQYSGGGCLLPLEIRNGEPTVGGQIAASDGHLIEARLELDTGAVFSIVTKHFGDDHPEIALRGKTIEQPRVPQAGGDARFRTGRIGAIHIGECVVQQPIVGFSEDSVGIGATKDFDIVLGGEELSQFTVAIDNQHQRVAFEPNHTFGKRSEELYMSGIHVIAEGEDFHAFRVDLAAEPDSPGEKGYIRQNDFIESVNGVSAEYLTLTEVREALRKPGKLHLGIRRGKKRFKTTLKLIPRI